MKGLVRFLPLAITRADDGTGCVAAVTSEDAWLRPQPVMASDVTGPRRRYRYGHWHVAEVASAAEADARPEDHALMSDVRLTDEVVDEGALHDLLQRLCDADVTQALGGARSMGLVRARPRRVYAKRSLAKKVFLRVVFEDARGDEMDWIVPEVRFNDEARPHLDAQEQLDDAWTSQLMARWQRAETFFLLGLTKPNHRFPGRFRGCHPLVVGIHTFPSYLDAAFEEAA